MKRFGLTSCVLAAAVALPVAFAAPPVAHAADPTPVRFDFGAGALASGYTRITAASAASDTQRPGGGAGGAVPGPGGRAPRHERAG